MKRSSVPLLALALVAVGVGAASIVACRGAEAPVVASSSSASSSAVDTSASSSPPASSSSSSAPIASSVVDPPPPVPDPPAALPATPAGPTKKLTIDQCLAMQAKLLAKITAKRAVILNSNSACKTDGECVLGAHGSCHSSCGGAAINTKGEGDLRAASNAVTDACKPWQNAGCSAVVPVATCPAFEAKCVGGKCAARSVH